jgi:hypothetical protein
MKIGQLCLHTPAIGLVRECEIVDGMRPRFIYDVWWYNLYVIRFADGTEITCCRKWLIPLNDGSHYVDSKSFSVTGGRTKTVDNLMNKCNNFPHNQLWSPLC